MAESLEKQIEIQKTELARISAEKAVLEKQKTQVAEIASLRIRKERELKRLGKIRVPTVKDELQKQKLKSGITKIGGFLKRTGKLSARGGKVLAKETEKLMKSKEFKQGVDIILKPKKKKSVFKKRSIRTRTKKVSFSGSDVSGKPRRVR